MIVDEGSFQFFQNGQVVRQEQLIVVQTTDGITASSAVVSSDGGHRAQTRWSIDSAGALRRCDAVGITQGREWTAEVIPAGDRATIRISGANPRSAEVPYQPGWLVDIDPTMVPFSMMLRRALAGSGDQTFRYLAYAPLWDALVTRVAMTVRHIGQRDGTDYLVVHEMMRGTRPDDESVTNRFHAWMRDGRLLRLEMVGERSMRIDREGAATDGLAPEDVAFPAVDVS